jgi:hypothetical protein
MYVQNIELENLRAFKKASIEFLYPGREKGAPFSNIPSWPPRLPNVNLLLGMNGSGKSTILDAIALAVLSPLISSSGYRPYALIRRDAKKMVYEASISADLVLHDQDASPALKEGDYNHKVKSSVRRRGDVELIKGFDEDSQIWSGMFNDKSPAFLLVGYGAKRRVEASSGIDISVRRRERQLRYERVASLFEEHFALLPLNAWLPDWRSLNPGRHKQVVNLINRLLPPDIKFTGELEVGEYLFDLRHTKVPFGALSDGYQAYIGWIGDLLHHVCMGCPPGKRLVDNKGVVLVDEIDLHIHPEWQRTIIPTLARTLPNLQFIFTTHSPLVVGTLESANIYYVHVKSSGNPVIQRPEEEVYGLSADQILRSQVFGLESTRDPEFKKELDELSAKAVLGDEKAAVRFMHQVARGSGGYVDDPAFSDDKPAPPDWVRKLAADRSGN